MRYLGAIVDVITGIVLPRLLGDKPDPNVTLKRLEKNRERIQARLDEINKRLKELRK